PGASHAANVAGGLTPLDDPRRRAELCTACHLGDASRGIVDHRLLAAGHPRLVFDLATATSLEPAHFRPDPAYVAGGRGRSAAVTLWAVGQGVAARRAAARIAGVVGAGGWPDVAAFDCGSCHHALGSVPVADVPTGLPAPDLSAFVAYGAVLE